MKPDIWYGYGIFPIDFNWELLPTVEDTVRRLSQIEIACFNPDREPYTGINDQLYFTVAQFMHDFNLAKAKAKKHLHWEGDYRELPRVIFIPNKDYQSEILYGFAWKHDNNGNSYVFAPMPMPWLDKESFATVVYDAPQLEFKGASE